MGCNDSPQLTRVMKEEANGKPVIPNKKVTVRDIADEVGFHFTTVASALRHCPKVKKATRDKVNRAAKKLGYKADPMLTALAAYRTGTKAAVFQGTLAWINGFDSPNFFNERRNGFYFESYQGAIERANVLGYRLEPFWMSEPGMSPKRASHILESRNVSGVIVGPMPHGVNELNLFWDKFCSVRIGYSLKNTELTTVIADQFGSMKTIFQKLLDDGYRKIGFACPRELDNRTNNQWSGAFCAMQLRYLNGSGIKPHLSANTTDGFIEWYEKNRPEVIITGVVDHHLQLLKGNNIDVPEQTQLISLHADNTSLPVAGIRQNGSVVGMTAIDHLVAIIHRFQRGIETHPKTVTIAGEWDSGDSYTPKMLFLKPLQPN